MVVSATPAVATSRSVLTHLNKTNICLGCFLNRLSRHFSDPVLNSICYMRDHCTFMHMERRNQRTSKLNKHINLSSLGEETQSIHTDFNLFLGPKHTMKFENAASFVWLGQLSTLISHQKSIRKLSPTQKIFQKPALRFSVDRKHVENGDFKNDPPPKVSSNTNKK